MTFTDFDKITLALLVAGIAVQLVSALIHRMSSNTVAKKTTLALIILIGIFQLVIIYGSLIEPRWIDVKTETIEISENPTNEIKVIVVSDFHVGPYKDDTFVAKVVEKVNAQNPDLVLMPGDFIYSYADQADYLYPLADIESKYGVYAVLGNHDYGLGRNNIEDVNQPGAFAKSEYVVEKLEEYKVTVLRNELTIIEAEKNINLVGLEDIWGNRYEYNINDFGINEDDTVIFLEHNPDIVMYDEAERSDLIISGHTHGGQISLPFWGPIPELPTQLGKEYNYGYFNYEGKNLFITKGIGEMGPRARLFTRPEIVVVNLNY